MWVSQLLHMDPAPGVAHPNDSLDLEHSTDGRTSSEHKNSANKISGNTKSFINWYHKRFCLSCSSLWYLHNNHPPLLQISAGSMLLQDEVRGCVWQNAWGREQFPFQHHFLINEKSTGTRQGFLIDISFYLCCKNKTSMTDNCFLLKANNYQQQQVNTLSCFLLFPSSYH